MKHSKIKNPSIVFELLLRKLTSDTINGVENSPSLSIIKEFFNKKTLIGKEQELYQVLTRNKFSSEVKANSLIEQVLASRRTINEKSLKKEKYEVIKKIKEAYDVDDFFNTKIEKYKQYAAIYKLFENDGSESPEELLNDKYIIVEHIVGQPVKKEGSEALLEVYENEDKDVRFLAYKILIDKFNKKYSSYLNEGQKRLLKEYIYNISNSTKLLEYVKSQIPYIKKEISSYDGVVEDKVIQIKLHETISMLNKFDNIKSVKDEHILSLLRYYDLVKELKEIKK